MNNDIKLKLKKAIYEIHFKILIQIPYINQGGCGWFAYYFASKLKELGIPYSIFVIDGHNEISYKNQVLEQIKKKEIKRLTKRVVNIIGASHIMVHIDDDFLVDGKSINRVNEYNNEKLHMGIYSFESLELVLRKASWVKLYNTNQNEDLKNIIYQSIDDVFVTKLKQIA